MTKLRLLAPVTFGLAVLAAAPAVFAQELKTETDKASYVIGHQLGSNLKKNEAEVNPEALVKGLKEALAGKNSALSAEDSDKIMNDFRTKLQTKAETRFKADADKNTKEGKAFLDENAKKPGVVKLPSGLQYKVVTEGKGDSPKETDTVVTHYKGTLINGTEFDSSYKRNQPATFPVNGVIKGWTEALKLMKPGAKWQLFIPPELAYGEQGAGPHSNIGPNSTLVFDIELISIEKAKEPAPTANKPAKKKS